MTKKEATARKLAWSAALSEGRVLRFDNGARLVSYPTFQACDAAFIAAAKAGIPCEVVS